MKKTLQDNMIEILINKQFKFWKSKKWFEQQIVIKKSTTKMKKSEKTIEQIIEIQRIIENNIKYETDSEIIIIDNIFV